MFLYTILTAEQIFPAQLPECTIREVGGDFVEYREVDGQRQVSRLISTDPKKYLDLKYEIGAPFFL